MNLKMREHSALNIWPSFADIALAMILVLIFFIIAQFLSNQMAIIEYGIKQRQEIVRQAFKKMFGEQMGKQITVEEKLNDQRFRFSDAILFDSGKADLKPRGEEILRQVGQIFVDHRSFYDRIYIEGHTDNVPIHKIQFPSNWELSSARATAVIRLFLAEFQTFQQHPRLLSATGYGEFLPRATNETEEGRELNRRIEIVLEYSPQTNWTAPMQSHFASE